MRRAVLVVFVAACGSKPTESRVENEVVAPPPMQDETRVVAAPDGGAPEAAAPAFSLPDVVGLPSFLAGFKPNAKRVDLAEPLAKLVVDETPRGASDILLRHGDRDAPFYKTPVPGLFMQLLFPGGRFAGVTFTSDDPNLIANATKVWGAGEPLRDEIAEIMAGPGGAKPVGRKWHSEARGWTAEQFTFTPAPRKDDRDRDMISLGLPDFTMGSTVPYGTLRIEVSNAQAATRTTPAERDETASDEPKKLADAQVFPLLQSLLGISIEAAAKKVDGTIETADDTIEAGGDKQVNAYLDVSWSPSPWQLTLSLGRDGKVGAVYATGDVTDDEGRIALMKALQVSFGAPAAVISPEGRVVLGFPRMGKRLDVRDNQESFEVMVTR